MMYLQYIHIEYTLYHIGKAYGDNRNVSLHYVRTSQLYNYVYLNIRTCIVHASLNAKFYKHAFIYTIEVKYTHV